MYLDRLPPVIPHPEDFIQTAMRDGIKSMEQFMIENEKKMSVIRKLETVAEQKVRLNLQHDVNESYIQAH